MLFYCYIKEFLGYIPFNKLQDSERWPSHAEHANHGPTQYDFSPPNLPILLHDKGNEPAFREKNSFFQVNVWFQIVNDVEYIWGGVSECQSDNVSDCVSDRL